MVLAVCAVVAMMPFPVSEPRQSEPARLCRWTSGLSTLIKDHLAGGASRLAALLLPQILPVFSVVAPCHPGAALRDLVLVQRGQATSWGNCLPNLLLFRLQQRLPAIRTGQRRGILIDQQHEFHP